MVSELKYFAAFTLPVITFASLWWPEYLCFATVIYAFGLIPFLELLIKPNTSNLTEEAEKSLQSNRFYDWLLYALVPTQYGLLGLFLYRVSFDNISTVQLIGMTASMGVHCGGVGINVAHELGHRVTRFERLLSRMLLLTSLYMHFTIEHNRGHHKWVATRKDPATARRNESIYRFWLRCIPSMFVSAWRIERAELQKHGRRVWGPSNEVLQLIVIEAGFVAAIGLFLSFKAAVCFLGAAMIGILVLESADYIEHYGLLRTETSPGKFERVQPRHSWNSDYVLGRIMLFELTRHADHHFSASRKYQILRHLPDGPQLPCGYPAAMLLALVPPLWFRIVHARLDSAADHTETATLSGR
nr:alkane-1-monooxygenase [uncultured bacterium]